MNYIPIPVFFTIYIIYKTRTRRWIHIVFFCYLDHNFWLGITDVVNGDWRWIYDQTRPNYKFWLSGHPRPASNAHSKNYNCGLMLTSGKWYDHACASAFYYICESNFCKFIILFRWWVIIKIHALFPVHILVTSNIFVHVLL